MIGGFFGAVSGANAMKNFREGKFAGAEKISGETLAANIEKRGGKTKHGCHTGCIIQCSQVYNDANGMIEGNHVFMSISGAADADRGPRVGRAEHGALAAPRGAGGRRVAGAILCT